MLTPRCCDTTRLPAGNARKRLPPRARHRASRRGSGHPSCSPRPSVGGVSQGMSAPLPPLLRAAVTPGEHHGAPGPRAPQSSIQMRAPADSGREGSLATSPRTPSLIRPKCAIRTSTRPCGLRSQPAHATVSGRGKDKRRPGVLRPRPDLPDPRHRRGPLGGDGAADPQATSVQPAARIRRRRVRRARACCRLMTGGSATPAHRPG